MTLSVIIPASNEEGWIGACLASVLASDPPGMVAEVVVVANGCRDGTVRVAQGYTAQAQAAGWGLRVEDLGPGSKPGALNHGDSVARGDIRVYLDADVTVSPTLLAQIAKALTQAPGAAYASGRPRLPPAASVISRAYGRFWMSLPFAQSPAPGFGLFAVNAAGRARWGQFPGIISDDTFVRLHFTPSERIEVQASYDWPMIEGFSNLARVRRRQDAGVREIAGRWPELLLREGKPPLGRAGLARLALRDPAGFLAYATVSLAVRLGRQDNRWTRGR
jgi:glycosyltransferase involved in cell wall biosynthesis